MQASVVISTKNRADRLSRLFDAYAEMQVSQSLQWELFVVDNGSKDKTFQTLLTELEKQRLPLSVMKEPCAGKSRALNSALSRVKGELVIFADDDMTPDKNWLNAFCAAFEKYPGMNCFTGKIEPVWEDALPSWMHLDGAFALPEGISNGRDFGPDDRVLGSGEIPGGANTAFTRHVIQKTGTFRVDLGPGTSIPLAEDTEYLKRLLNRNERIFYVSDALMYHFNPADRMTVKYAENWIFQSAYCQVKAFGKKVDAPEFFNVPRYLFKQFVKRLISYCAECRHDNRFYKKLRLIHTMGEIKGHFYKESNLRKKRILYVENGIGYGGAAICLRHLVRNLDRSMYTPLVITGRTGPQFRQIASEAVWKHIPDRRIDVPGLRQHLERVIWVQAVPGLKLFADKLLSRVDDVYNFFPFFVQFAWTAVIFRPHLIHVNNEPYSNRAAVLAGKCLRIPVVSHIRGPNRGSAITRFFYKLPDHFIPVSNWISSNTEKIGIPLNKRTVVYDGIALEALDLNADGNRFRKMHSINTNDFVVGLIGMLIPWKGQKIFIDAAGLLSDRIPGLKMLIVGGTPEECREYEQNLKQRVQDKGLVKTVLFTGHVDDMEIVYNGVDAVVSASLAPEPLGTVVIECMAMGRPLVAPAHGGAAEMADNNITALLFEPGNAESLAESIFRLFESKTLRCKLGRNAREKAFKMFSVSRHVNEVQSVYRKVLNTAF